MQPGLGLWQEGWPLFPGGCKRQGPSAMQHWPDSCKAPGNFHICAKKAAERGTQQTHTGLPSMLLPLTYIYFCRMMTCHLS